MGYCQDITVSPTNDYAYLPNKHKMLLKETASHLTIE